MAGYSDPSMQLAICYSEGVTRGLMVMLVVAVIWLVVMFLYETKMK